MLSDKLLRAVDTERATRKRYNEASDALQLAFREDLAKVKHNRDETTLRELEKVASGDGYLEMLVLGALRELGFEPPPF